jgi:hypothetical protein
MSTSIENSDGRGGVSANSRTQVEKIDAVFEKLIEQRDLLRTNRKSRAHKHDPQSHVRDIVDLLYSLVASLDRYLRAQVADASSREASLDASALVRALLLSDKGARFEPCIFQCIRDYRTAFDNVRRYDRVDLPEAYRVDVLARFRQQLDCADQCLQLLGVDRFEAMPGDSISARRHRVLKTLLCVSVEQAETVESSLFPGFEWIDDQGNCRVQPAEVVAFGPFVPTTTAEAAERRSVVGTTPRRAEAIGPRAITNASGKRGKS